MVTAANKPNTEDVPMLDAGGDVSTSGEDAYIFEQLDIDICERLRGLDLS